MIRIKKKSIRNFFFLLAILLILFISAARPHNQPPRIELGGTVHLDCSPGCDYWDGHRWHCCGNGGGGPTNQPPTITAALLCARNGTNGWCRSGAQLQLSASDPQGYTVSIIGDVGNGVEFTCGSSCIEDLPEGTGTANYTATAATSNLTASGNTPWYYDATPPTATLIISSGTLGSTGWYTTPVVVTTGATDGISGVGPIVMSDNGSFSNTNSLTLGDGSHTVFTIVTDNAGNTASASLPPIHIDTTAPTFAPVISGTSVASGWYSGSVSVNANASDNASGIAAVSYQLDGGAWTSGSSVTANTSGSHIAIFRATDNAGNESTSAQQLFSIDNDPPVIALTPIGTSGTNGWYTSNVSVGYIVTDALIGVGATQFTIDGVVDSSLANTKSGSLPALSDGTHNISVTANDLAGNAATQNLSLKIDTVPPSLSTAIFPTLPDGSNGWYKSPVALSATAADSGSGIASIDHQLDGGAWTSGAGFTVSSDGSHTVSSSEPPIRQAIAPRWILWPSRSSIRSRSTRPRR